MLDNRLSLAVAFAAILVPAASRTHGGEPAVPAFRVYSHLLDPREHPDYERRAVKPPTWETFKGRTQFTCLRGLTVEGERIVGFREELEKFTRTHELGDVIWPSYPILFAKNLDELADEIARRELYLFDIWGYVPGSGPGGYWMQFAPPPEAFAVLEAKLGARWLGTDIGEQDGRYVGGYAEQLTPASARRIDQYANFQRHFERMGDDLGHKHATLVSLNFGHYFLKEGTYTLIGAETAQGLPNNLRASRRRTGRRGDSARRAAAPSARADPALAERAVDQGGAPRATAPRVDIAGRLWDAHAPIHSAPDAAALARWIAVAAELPVLFDAVYTDSDEEYLDATVLGR